MAPRSGRRRWPEWNADTDFDVWLQDVPRNNRRLDVTVHQADTIDVIPALTYTYVLDPGTGRHLGAEGFTGVVKVAAPFALEVDLGRI